MHQTLTTISVRIKSSDNNMHIENQLTICALKTSKRSALVPARAFAGVMLPPRQKVKVCPDPVPVDSGVDTWKVELL